MTHESGELTAAPHKRWQPSTEAGARRPGRTGEVERGVTWGGRLWGGTSTCSRLEAGALGGGQPKRVDEQRDRVLARRESGAALQRADIVGAQPRTLRQFRLGQSGGAATALE